MRIALPLLAAAACSRHARVEQLAARGEQIAIVVAEPGASAGELETTVAVPIERALPRAEHVRTKIEPGRVKIELELGGGDALAAVQDLQDRLSKLLAQLPHDIEPPIVQVEPAEVSALRYTLRSDTLPRTILSGLDADTVHGGFERLAGVTRIDSCGAQRARLTIDVDPQALAASGLAIGDIATALRKMHVSVDVDRDAMADIVIAYRNGAPTRLRDVARLLDGAAPLECRALDERGQVITGTVLVRAGTDPEPVRAAVAGIRTALPTAVTLEVLPPAPAQLGVDVDDSARLPQLRDAIAKLPGLAHVIVEDRGDTARVLAFPADVEHAAIVTLRDAGFHVHPRGELVVQLLGPDRTQLTQLAHTAADALRARTDVVVDGGIALTASASLHVVPDRDTAAQLGVAISEVSDAIRAISDDGLAIATVIAGRTPVPIVLTCGGREQLMHAYVRGSGGVLVPLSSIAHVEQTNELAELRREDGVPWVGIAASGEPDAIRAAIDHLALPAGVRARVVAAAP